MRVRRKWAWSIFGPLHMELSLGFFGNQGQIEQPLSEEISLLKCSSRSKQKILGLNIQCLCNVNFQYDTYLMPLKKVQSKAITKAVFCLILMDIKPKLGGVVKILFYSSQKRVNVQYFRIIPSLYNL